MATKRKGNTTCLLIIMGVILFTIMIVISELGFLSDLNYDSPDISVSGSFLCKSINGECVFVDDNQFSSNEFSHVQVCMKYSSTHNSSVETRILIQGTNTIIGSKIDRELGKGDFEVCYSLNGVVGNWVNTFGSDSPSPVQDGVIEPGKYRIIFKQGREMLDELEFKVSPSG